MIYRQAQSSDQEQIALLHADSWRRTYRGIFSDKFLEYDADTDRRCVWAQRLSTPLSNQMVYVADKGTGHITGFICAYGNEDPQWGSLVDNLHVQHTHRGQGIGSSLMHMAFNELQQHYPWCGVYLWVMQDNRLARHFYIKHGAHEAGVMEKPNPVGGGSAVNCRYIWATPTDFIAQCQPCPATI